MFLVSWTPGLTGFCSHRLRLVVNGEINSSPFSQRVWIALEAKGLPYQYCETDPFRKPKPTQLLEANPRGLVPAIRQGEWACGESAVILEYVCASIFPDKLLPRRIVKLTSYEYSSLDSA